MLPTMADQGDILLVARNNFCVNLISHFDSSILPQPKRDQTKSDVRFTFGSFTRHLRKLFTTGQLEYARGDVIVALSPANPKQKVCKRIIGMVRRI